MSASRPSEEQAALLRMAVVGEAVGAVSGTSQRHLLAIPGSPLIFWLPAGFQRLFAKQPSLGGEAGIMRVRDGMNTGDNARFVRQAWEIRVPGTRWRWYSKGGGYARWAGFEQYVLDWGEAGERMMHARLPGTFFRSIELFFQPGLCYSLMARGSLGVRLTEDCAYDGTGLAVQCRLLERQWLAALLNTRLSTYAARLMAQAIKFRGGYVERIPGPPTRVLPSEDAVETMVLLKRHLLAHDPLERSFAPGLRLRSHGRDPSTAVGSDAYDHGSGPATTIADGTGTAVPEPCHATVVAGPAPDPSSAISDILAVQAVLHTLEER